MLDYKNISSVSQTLAIVSCFSGVFGGAFGRWLWVFLVHSWFRCLFSFWRFFGRCIFIVFSVLFLGGVFTGCVQVVYCYRDLGALELSPLDVDLATV
jgi:hypothetical protein